MIFRFLQEAPTESKSSSGFVSTAVSLCLLWTNVQPVVFTTLFITTSLKAVCLYLFVQAAFEEAVSIALQVCLSVAFSLSKCDLGDDQGPF